MKLFQVVIVVLLLGCATGQAALSYNTFSSGSLNTAIPDANPTGISSSITVSAMQNSLAAVNVYLNVSGGYSGDAYAYLSYGGMTVVLLNRIGKTASNPFGSSASGFGTGATDFKFSDAATVNGNIHSYGGSGPITGFYQPDGRTTNPQLVLNTDTPTTSLANFNNLNPNGAWTLFFADMASGNQSTLVSWGLEITAIPEPINVALMVFAATLGGVKLFALRRALAVRQSCNPRGNAWPPALSPKR